jgi:hypothetical protein
LRNQSDGNYYLPRLTGITIKLFIRFDNKKKTLLWLNTMSFYSVHLVHLSSYNIYAEVKEILAKAIKAFVLSTFLNYSLRNYDKRELHADQVYYYYRGNNLIHRTT